jgi:hypothetical protein
MEQRTPIGHLATSEQAIAAAAKAFGMTDTVLRPADLANCVVPRRNLCAEFSQLPTDKLLEEANEMLVRMDRAGRPTDHAIVAALIRHLQRKPKLEGSLWLDLPGTAS